MIQSKRVIAVRPVRAAEEERGNSMEKNAAASAGTVPTADASPAVVDFFQGRQRALWIAALAISFAIAAVGIALAFSLPPRGAGEDYTLNIILAVFGFPGLGVFLVCVMTAKMRTSKWVADGVGVSYYCFGRKTMALSWKEMKEAGYLKIANPRTHVTAYYLYWTTEELMSACRDFIRGGVMEHKPKYLGRYNRRKGSIILYAIDPYDPVNDPLVTFTQAHYPHQLKNPKVLGFAEEAAKEQ